MKSLDPNQFLNKSGLTVGQILKACYLTRCKASKMSEKNKENLLRKARNPIH